MYVADKLLVRTKALLLSQPKSSIWGDVRIGSIEENANCSKAQMIVDIPDVGRFRMTLEQL